MKNPADFEKFGKNMRASLSDRVGAALLCALIMSCAAGCTADKNNSSSAVSEKSDVSTVSESSNTNEKNESEQSAEASDNSGQQSAEQSTDNSEESSKASSDDVEESEEDNSEEESVVGYQFDDEQIVEDYHTATEFTSNEDFNKIFKDNALDKEYNSKLQDASTITDMRITTTYFAQEWEELTDRVYGLLKKKLSKDEEGLAKLHDSQESWTNSIGEVEESFTEEAKDGGTEGLLAADSAMLNYYKGRAAVLLCTIYELDPEGFSLSEYGL